MCAHVNATSVMMLAEMRRADLLQQAEHYRLMQQAVSLDAGRGPRGIDLRAELMALHARISAMARPVPARHRAPDPT